ncbi:hypothetical protein [Streptomyces sp. NPDC055243]
MIEPGKPDSYVDLVIFDPNGWQIDGAVKRDDARAADQTWHWPTPDC